VALLAAGVALAVLLVGRRDLGAGLFAARRGPARAAPGLLSPAGLVWRLHRGALLGWAVAVTVLGFSMGVAADEVNDMVGENPAAAEAIAQLGGGANLVDAFLSAMLGLFALTIGAYVVQALLRTRGDETDGLLEAILATAVDRVGWLVTQVLGAILGAATLLLLAGAATGLGYGVVAGDPLGRAASLGGAALLRLPALLVVAGVATLLVGLAPRWSVALSWSALIGFLLLGQLGAVLDLPQLVLDASPFTHVPSAPADPVTALPLVVLSAVALAVGVLGLAAFNRRDLAT
jgi:ABC-2 type transport system permease protein